MVILLILIPIILEKHIICVSPFALTSLGNAIITFSDNRKTFDTQIVNLNSWHWYNAQANFNSEIVIKNISPKIQTLVLLERAGYDQSVTDQSVVTDHYVDQVSYLALVSITNQLIVYISAKV